MNTTFLHYHPDVAAALKAGRPVVALESTLITHGLPYPVNQEVARAMEQTVREAGATPDVMIWSDPSRRDAYLISGNCKPMATSELTR